LTYRSIYHVALACPIQGSHALNENTACVRMAMHCVIRPIEVRALFAAAKTRAS